MNKKLSKRIDIVRSAVAEATKDLKPAEYRELMEELLADADGWRMEREENEGEEDEV